MIFATGRALREGTARGQNNFKLFVENPADELDVCLHLDVGIEGPGKSQLTTQNFGNGTISVNYRVAKEGPYIINVTYQGKHVAGSPFHIKVR
ncbi:Filamin-A [Orchesella cincta]|uniref:Filamin-A n=1 Tax=Orchesella cincta TaxID=48709 RepID=A0A1D2MKW4_ORCCI|nr:Filamin-A [Orchesella cincta]